MTQPERRIDKRGIIICVNVFENLKYQGRLSESQPAAQVGSADADGGPTAERLTAPNADFSIVNFENLNLW